MLNSASIFSEFDKTMENATINEEAMNMFVETKNFNNSLLNNNSNSAMSQKSMSTTNLFDVVYCF